MSNTLHRTASANLYDTAIGNLMTRQTNLSKLQEGLTAGKRVVRASDDPVAAAQAERAITRMARIQTEQRALEIQRNNVMQAESALGEAVGMTQEFRDLVVRAGNASLTPANRSTIADQLQGLREQILDIANRKDTNGMPLLGSLGSTLTAFFGPQSDNPDYEFQGLIGQAASNGPFISSSIDGYSGFMFDAQRDAVYNAAITPAAGGGAFTTSAVTVTDNSQTTGNNYSIAFSAVGPGATPGTTTVTYTVTDTTTGIPLSPVTVPDFPDGQAANFSIDGIPGLSLSFKGIPANGDAVTLTPNTSVFGTMDAAIAGFRAAGSSHAASQVAIQTLANLDTSISRLDTLRGYAGELLNRADRITGDQDKRAIQLEADRSRAEDIDMIKGLSDFAKQQTGYDAAIKSYAQIQQLSLFKYIG